MNLILLYLLIGVVSSAVLDNAGKKVGIRFTWPMVVVNTIAWPYFIIVTCVKNIKNSSGS